MPLQRVGSRKWKRKNKATETSINSFLKLSQGIWFYLYGFFMINSPHGKKCLYSCWMQSWISYPGLTKYSSNSVNRDSRNFEISASSLTPRILLLSSDTTRLEWLFQTKKKRRLQSIRVCCSSCLSLQHITSVIICKKNCKEDEERWKI